MAEIVFHRKMPDLLVVDDFFVDPDRVREMALDLPYSADERYYKGQRSDVSYLWDALREEFERLLDCTIIDWMDQSANGVFQMTSSKDPIVWHADSQDYAAAIYLNPGTPTGGGTSFWRNREHGFRFFHNAPEGHQVKEADLLSEDSWELVESISGIYNRLAIWNARLIHSATSYESFVDQDQRLVQLFFFNVRPN